LTEFQDSQACLKLNVHFPDAHLPPTSAYEVAQVIALPAKLCDMMQDPTHPQL
jgi:hypothetical protein